MVLVREFGVSLPILLSARGYHAAPHREPGGGSLAAARQQGGRAQGSGPRVSAAEEGARFAAPKFSDAKDLAGFGAEQLASETVPPQAHSRQRSCLQVVTGLFSDPSARLLILIGR